MTCVHVCQWCGRDYPCSTTEEVSEDVYRCACKSTDECPGCSEHGACADCGEQPAGSETNEELCDGCAERWLENYEPPDPDLSGPNYREQSAHWAEQRSRDRGR